MPTAADDQPRAHNEIVSAQLTPLGETAALVVDDSLPTRVQMRGGLSSIVSRVDFAETGGRALELIDTRSYSMIFLDMTLPDEDAYEICGRVKKHPLQQQASVVMLTNNSSSADRVVGMLAGFDNCLVKPIKRDAFSGLAAKLARPAATF
jgi:DNA-binding response OmpR family regulator